MVLFQPFNKLRIIASFEINKAYIVANLCENRETPKGLDCAGRCYLKKQLTEAAEEEAAKIPQNIKEKIECWSVQMPTTFLFETSQLFASPKKTICNSFYLLNLPDAAFADIFHPPSA